MKSFLFFGFLFLLAIFTGMPFSQTTLSLDEKLPFDSSITKGRLENGLNKRFIMKSASKYLNENNYVKVVLLPKET